MQFPKLTAEEMERANCFNDASAPFFISALLAFFLFAAWVKREHDLTSWSTFLVMCGLVRVKRTWKMNLLHFLSLVTPFLVVFSSPSFRSCF
ncbi:MAG: hypothetical protein K0U74_06780 [Alphaproteobacteria bacterium]|nr:hypothetical protein [Alphaproteobacteria bacterium]